jgi:hypothetical protein
MFHSDVVFSERRSVKFVPRALKNAGMRCVKSPAQSDCGSGTALASVGISRCVVKSWRPVAATDRKHRAAVIVRTTPARHHVQRVVTGHRP